MDPLNNPVEASRPEALRALLEASAILLTTSSSAQMLSGILDLAQNVIHADAYAVWQTKDAEIWRMAASRGLGPDYRTEVKSPRNYVPKLEAIPDVTAHPLVERFQELYARYGIRSLLIVPLTLQHSIPAGPNGGTITFYWKTPREFTELDVTYASALANLSSAALNLAELNHQNQRERRRLRLLSDASDALASSLDYETTLERVARLAVPEIADWCVVHILENGIPNRIVVMHADPDQLARAREYSTRYPEQIVPERGLGYVLHTGKSEFLPSISDHMIAAAARNGDHLQLLRDLQLRGSILVPLCAHDGKILGAIRLLASGDRTFGEDDLRLAEDLARRASAAFENALLHRELLNQEHRLRLAHAAAHMGTWSWDLVRNELFWSDEWKRLHGLPLDVHPAPEIGQGLVHPEEREQVFAQLTAAIDSREELVVFEHRVLTWDRRVIWVHHRARIERDTEGRAVSILGISMDITERRVAEDTLRRTEKLAAAGRLAATVAHEINNPLEAIVNLIYIAKLSPALPPEVGELLTTAEAELNRTAHIVRQTLGFYREAVHPKSTDIGHIVSEILELYRSRLEARSLTLHTRVEGKITAAVIPGELKQVIANLVSNAIDATPPGGSIHVAVEGDADTVRVTVRDTGTGIESGHIPRLFEPFFTTKADVGTGLGLWVSKEIVEKHHGAIAVETSTSPEKSGTTFTITLPSAKSPAAGPFAAVGQPSSAEISPRAETATVPLV